MVPYGIARFVAIPAVLIAIELNNKPRPVFYEVQNAGAEWRLPAEVIPLSIQCSKVSPHNHFALGRAISQCASSSFDYRSNTTAHPPTPTPPHKGEGDYTMRIASFGEAERAHQPLAALRRRLGNEKPAASASSAPA